MAVRFPPQQAQPLDVVTQGLQRGLGIGLNINALVARKRQKEQARARLQEQEKLNSAYKALGAGLKMQVGDEQLDPFLDVINANLRKKGFDTAGLDLTGRKKEFMKKLVKLRTDTDKTGDKEAGALGLKLLFADFPRESKSFIPELQDLEQQIAEGRRKTLLSGTTSAGLPLENEVFRTIPPEARRAIAADPSDPVAKKFLEVSARKQNVPPGSFIWNVLKENLSPEDFKKAVGVRAGIVPKAVAGPSFAEKERIRTESAKGLAKFKSELPAAGPSFQKKEDIRTESFKERKEFEQGLKSQIAAKGKLSSAERKQAAEISVISKDFDNLKSLFNLVKGSIGPVEGRLKFQLFDKAGGRGLSEDEQNYFAAQSQIYNTMIKLITGAQVRESEEARIIRQLPRHSDTPQQWEAKWNQTKRNMNDLSNSIGKIQTTGKKITHLSNKEQADAILSQFKNK